MLALSHDWSFWARPEQLAPADKDWFAWLVLAGRGWGKALSLSTPIPVPSGWKLLADIAVGDEVFDESGRVCRVTATFEVDPEESYRVHFSDGTHLDACSEHQWVTWTQKELTLFLEENPDATGFPDEWPDWKNKDGIGPRIRTTRLLKATLWKRHAIPARESKNFERRIVKQIEPIENEPMRCLTVDGRHSMYLAGESMVPTHNTRTGVEWIRGLQESGKYGRFALVGQNAADVRDVIVEGESGLLAVSHPHNKPKYEPSKRRLTWPNGATATTYSGDEPDQLRGPQNEAALCDEIAKWKYAQETWDNLEFGLRLGDNPRVCVTTTPRPTKIIKQLVADPQTVVTRGNTYDNIANLAPTFIKRVIAKYEGTRLGRQELNAEILDDAPGALWNRDMIESLRLNKAPHFHRSAVAIDPAVSNTEDSDATGIVAGGIGMCMCKGFNQMEMHGFVTHAVPLKASPTGWGQEAIDLYHRNRADVIVAEVNNGGDMIEHVLRGIDENVSYKKVHATRGKVIRAEPIASLYEQMKIHHIGTFPELEDELCEWEPGGKSPNCLDACVWLMTELMLGGSGDAEGEAQGTSFGVMLAPPPTPGMHIIHPAYDLRHTPGGFNPMLQAFRNIGLD